MTTAQRISKIQALLSTDLNLLERIEEVVKNYRAKSNDPYSELPKVAQQILNESIEDAEAGKVRLHKDVMADVKEKYNIKNSK